MSDSNPQSDEDLAAAWGAETDTDAALPMETAQPARVLTHLIQTHSRDSLATMA